MAAIFWELGDEENSLGVLLELHLRISHSFIESIWGL